MSIFQRFFGSSNDRKVKTLIARVGKINALEPKMQALSELIALGDAKDAARRAETANACLELLSLHPTNARALAILSESPKPWPPDVSFVTGYAAYLGKDYSKAAALLRTVPIASKNGRMARYYRGFSLMRLGRGAEALDVFGPLALSGKGYADSAVRRIALLSKGTLKEPGVALLRKVVATRRGDMAARAMEALSRLLSGAEARTMEDRVVREYPDSEHAAGILWERGWKRWDAGAVADALAVWKKLLTPGVDGSWAPRVLYWVGRGYERLGKKDRATVYFNRLGRSYPLSIHAFLAFPNGVNVEFIHVDGPGALSMRVYERGVGETRSCGTGVVASAAAYRAASDHEGPVRVTVPGGELTVDFDGDNARLTGPAVIVGRGEFWI